MTQTQLPAAFRALLLTQEDQQVRAQIQDVPTDQLPAGDVLVQVEMSSLNYKDGLAVAGKPGVVRSYPMVPGIDLAGRVLESGNPEFEPGDPVLVTGWGIGEAHWGGYGQLARVRSEWLTRLPGRFSAQDAMAVGTAGFTAMLSVLALEDRGLQAGAGEVLVTGATGGVGSVAVALLAARGHNVVASTGRPEEEAYLRGLGAGSLIGRDELSGLKRPLERERWAGAVDVVGGETLAGVLSSLRRGAAVAASGLVGGVALATTVMPFILRGVALLGIDSVMCLPARRQQAWDRLAQDLPAALLRSGVQVRGLSEVEALAQDILAGKIRGRTVIDVNA